MSLCRIKYWHKSFKCVKEVKLLPKLFKHAICVSRCENSVRTIEKTTNTQKPTNTFDIAISTSSQTQKHLKKKKKNIQKRTKDARGPRGEDLSVFCLQNTKLTKRVCEKNIKSSNKLKRRPKLIVQKQKRKIQKASIGRTCVSCERVVHRHGAILLIVRECSGFNPRRVQHCGSFDVQDREQVDSGEKVEARERERGRRQNENKRRTLKHVTSWMTCRRSECAPKTP